MNHMLEHTDVTFDNFEEVLESIPYRDQRNEMMIGCQTWPIIYQPGNQRGQGTWWTNGRIAIALGSDSIWGDMVDDETMLSDDGEYYDLAGNPKGQDDGEDRGER